MPNNKRQHFVPQFYLRYFANPDRRSVGVFNIARQRFAARASLKGQAYRDWFYGKDLHAERGIAEIETATATILDAIVHQDRLPPRYSPDHHSLLTFAVLQLGRTTAAEALVNEQANKLGKRLLQHHLKDPELLRLLPGIRIKLTNAVSQTIAQSMTAVPILYDLKYKLIQNVSGNAFIASDAPVALHNRIFEDVAGISALGLANVGLQIFLPVGPRRAVLFYDEMAYDVGTRMSNIIRLRNPDHVRLINDLQWEIAHENIYVSPETDPAELLRDGQRWAPLRRGERAEVRDVELREGGRRGVVLTLSRIPSAVRLDLPIVRKLLQSPQGLDRFARLPARNPDWASFVLEAGRALEDRRITPDQYLELTTRVPVVPRAAKHRP